ncbi:MAG: OmpA family protein [Pseudomonadota bacterium]|nr:OmpA family protein [Pseudomonadota bacterium]
MHPLRALTLLALSGAVVATAACTTGRYGDPYAGRGMVSRPTGEASAATVGAYLVGDVVGGRSSRRAKFTGAKIRALGGGEVRAYMDAQEADLRRQMVSTGVEVIRSGEDVILRMPASITFPVGSFAIQPQFQSTLREIAQTLRSGNRTLVDVLGHTDASGSEASNQALSVSRAQAVANYLKSRGVGSARVAVKGYGETTPIADNDSEEGRALNRRIEIRIVGLT